METTLWQRCRLDARHLHCQRKHAPQTTGPPLRCSRRRQRDVRRRAGEEDAETRLLQEDMERLRARQSSSANASSSKPSSPPQADQGDSGLKGAIDKVLVADFFLVCLALAWLAAGVAEKGALNSSRLLDAWFPLWNVVFQPAIGVLMLGALVSGGMGWLRSKREQ